MDARLDDIDRLLSQLTGRDAHHRRRACLVYGLAPLGGMVGPSDLALLFDRCVLAAGGLDADADARSGGVGSRQRAAPSPAYHTLFRGWLAFGFPAFGAVLRSSGRGSPSRRSPGSQEPTHLFAVGVGVGACSATHALDCVPDPDDAVSLPAPAIEELHRTVQIRSPRA
jgi:hypothetical protein